MDDRTVNTITISRKLQLQIDRLKKSKCCLRDEEIETRTRFTNSEIGREIEMLRKNIGEQWSIIDSFQVTDFIKQVQVVLKSNRQEESINEIVRKRNMSNADLDELNELIVSKTQELNDNMEKLKMTRINLDVLEDLKKSTFDDNNQIITK